MSVPRCRLDFQQFTSKLSNLEDLCTMWIIKPFFVQSLTMVCFPCNLEGGKVKLKIENNRQWCLWLFHLLLEPLFFCLIVLSSIFLYHLRLTSLGGLLFSEGKHMRTGSWWEEWCQWVSWEEGRKEKLQLNCIV